MGMVEWGGNGVMGTAVELINQIGGQAIHDGFLVSC